MQRVSQSISYDPTWQEIVGNLFIGLTGLGLIALAIKAIVSHAQTGHACLFFKPAHQTDIEVLEDEVEDLEGALNMAVAVAAA